MRKKSEQMAADSEAGSTIRLQVRRFDGYTVLACLPECSLDTANAQEFKRQVLASYQPGEILILDLENLAFLDSAALSVLIHLRKRILETGGNLKLANIGPTIQKLLHITRLHRVFEIYDSVEAAAQSLRRETGQVAGNPPFGIHLQVTHRGSFSVVRITQPDSLIAVNCRPFRDKIRQYLREREAVILNLDAITNMDSAGVATLIHLKRYADENGRRIVLVGKNSVLARLFRLYSLDRVFPIFESEQLAARELLRHRTEEAAGEPQDGVAPEKTDSGYGSQDRFRDISYLTSRQK